MTQPGVGRDYQPLLARRVAREVPALFRAGSASPSGVIPLTYGFPDPGSFPIEALIDSQDDANFWDPSKQLRVIKKRRKPPPYPEPSQQAPETVTTEQPAGWGD